MMLQMQGFELKTFCYDSMLDYQFIPKLPLGDAPTILLYSNSVHSLFGNSFSYLDSFSLGFVYVGFNEAVIQGKHLGIGFTSIAECFQFGLLVINFLTLGCIFLL